MEQFKQADGNPMHIALATANLIKATKLAADGTTIKTLSAISPADFSNYLAFMNEENYLPSLNGSALSTFKAYTTGNISIGANYASVINPQATTESLTTLVCNDLKRSIAKTITNVSLDMVTLYAKLNSGLTKLILKMETDATGLASASVKFDPATVLPLASDTSAVVKFVMKDISGNEQDDFTINQGDVLAISHISYSAVSLAGTYLVTITKDVAVA